DARDALPRRLRGRRLRATGHTESRHLRRGRGARGRQGVDCARAERGGSSDSRWDGRVLHRVRRRADRPRGRGLLLRSRWSDGHLSRAFGRDARRQGALRFEPPRPLVWAVAMKAANHALQLIRPSRSGCNPRVSWAGSLSLPLRLSVKEKVLMPILGKREGTGEDIETFVEALFTAAAVSFPKGLERRWARLAKRLQGWPSLQKFTVHGTPEVFAQQLEGLRKVEFEKGLEPVGKCRAFIYEGAPLLDQAAQVAHRAAGAFERPQFTMIMECVAAIIAASVRSLCALLRAKLRQ